MTLETFARIGLMAYMGVMGLLCVYGLHRYFLVFTWLRFRRAEPARAGDFRDLPVITVQLPMFNERYVADRVIENACRIDYPRDRLQIQVLDDSTDDTREIAAAAVARMRATGFDIDYLHRTDRTGYKAGALEAGLHAARGEYIAIFDADFVPPPDILRNTVHYFTDPGIGMVQCRWEHLNRDASLLTQAQAILLDGHFVIEHTARNRSGRFMSFNGTAGIWRKSAIADAGGWQHDTLTEDLDLSYRAQLRGWRFVFLPNLASPAELPPEMSAFKAQQHRWTKGGAQTCVKLLPRVLAAPGRWWVKLEAFFHLTSGVVYILMVLLSLLIGPALLSKVMIPQEASILNTAFEAVLFVIGFGSGIIFYGLSQRQLRSSWFESLRYMPAMLAIGVGIAFNNAVAALDGFFGSTGEFVRTPKFGDDARSSAEWRKRISGFRSNRRWQAWAELIIGVYLTLCLVALFFFENWFERASAAIPFLLLFIVGYFYVSVQTLYSEWLARPRMAPPAAATPA